MNGKRAFGLGIALTLGSIVSTGPASANDSVAEVGIGGLALARTDAVEMVKEDLFLSATDVTVDYVFRNTSDADVSSIVAFPLPDMTFDLYRNTSLPEASTDHFVSFDVTVDGERVKPELDQRAFSLNVDVTDVLKKYGIPLYGYDPNAQKALDKLTEAQAQDLVSRGIISVNTYNDADKGETTDRSPTWTLRSAYWWKATFPKGKDVRVHHHYKPAVGGAAVAYLLDDDRQLTVAAHEYQTRYCLDDTLIKTLKQKLTPEGYLPFGETWIDYVLTSGGNWATGRIGEFHLTVDKGSEKNLISFCGTGVKKVSPTRFEMTAKDFYPERDIAVLILDARDEAQ